MKVFGIGWHKTATHSLQEALNILGYKGVHYPYELYYHFRNGRSAVKNYMRCCKSCSDFPVPLFFESFDALYPDSKFILTIRDEQSWLASIEKHFELMQKPRDQYGGQSEDDYKIAQGIPIHEIHYVAYERITFDAGIFLERYRRHNNYVQDYFAHRPDDLLVMDMTKGEGWAGLCDFLDREKPSIPYPVKYRTRDRIKEVST